MAVFHSVFLPGYIFTAGILLLPVRCFADGFKWLLHLEVLANTTRSTAA